MIKSAFLLRTLSFYLYMFSVLQLYLLAADPSPTVTAIFRIHLNLLNGPVLAYLFPETESRIVSYNMQLSKMKF